MGISESFIFSINAVLPLVLLSAIGYFLRRANFLTEEFIKVGNNFLFRVCLSSLMFVNIYSIKEFSLTYLKIMAFTVASILTMVLVSFVFCAFFVKDPKQKGVIAQNFFRSNFAIIGIPLAQTLFGEKGGAVGAVILSCTIPLFNIFAVIALTIFIKDDSDVQPNDAAAHKNHKISVKSILYKIITNPLIDGVLAGAVVLAVRPYANGWSLKDGDFRFLYKTIENLSKIASPLALVILGGQFKFSAVKRLFSKIFFSVLMRLVIVPVVGLSIAHLLFPEFSGPEFAGLLALFGTPAAVSGVIMAYQMNNDGELAGQILVWTTLFSGFTLFLFITFFRATGIF